MPHADLVELLAPLDAFPRRHLGPKPSDIERMVEVLGADSLDALMRTPVGGGSEAPRQLGSVVSLSRVAQAPALTSYNTQTLFNVFANVEGRDLGSVSRDIERLLDEIRPKPPRGSHLTLVISSRSSFASADLALNSGQEVFLARSIQASNSAFVRARTLAPAFT